MKQNLVDRHVFSFNPDDNGGEQLTLVTEVFDNGGGEVFTNQELTLHSYCNSASFTLSGAQILPEDLRRLANELDGVYTRRKALSKAKAEIMKR